MALKKLVICGEDNEVMFAGTSEGVGPVSGVFAIVELPPEGDADAAEAPSEALEADERLTIPVPPYDACDDDDDEPPTLWRALLMGTKTG